MIVIYQLLLPVSTAAIHASREVNLFDDSWRFLRDESPGYHPDQGCAFQKDIEDKHCQGLRQVKCVVMPDTDINPHTSGLGSAPGTSAEECCALCSSAEWAAKGCQFWTLSRNTCWFKSAVHTKLSSPGKISGQVFTPNNGTGACGAACCADKKCTTWQWCPPTAPCAQQESPGGGCWIGEATAKNCSPSTSGWVTRSRDPISNNTLCTTPFCMPSYNDSSWRTLDVPHDWSREDLPSRTDDKQFPVLGIRYGPWKVKAGDNASWSERDFDDREWQSAQGGVDWRQYGEAFARPGAVGWYRQHLSPPPAWLASVDPLAPVTVTLSLGVVAGADQTYLNGHLIGSSASLDVRDYVTPRAYAIPAGLLNLSRVPGANVVAVRVSVFGQSNSSSPQPSYGGLFDNPAIANHDTRAGPFDAAVSAGGKATGYTVGGVGWYRKSFECELAAGQRAWLRFDGVYMDSSVYVNGYLVGRHPVGLGWEGVCAYADSSVLIVDLLQPSFPVKF